MAKSKAAAGRTARSRGKANELYVCKKLDLVLPEWAPWVRNHGEKGQQLEGDVTPSPTTYERHPFMCECKYRQTWTYKNVIEWWHANRKLAEELRKLHPILVVRSFKGNPPVLFCEAEFGRRIARGCFEQGIILAVPPVDFQSGLPGLDRGGCEDTSDDEGTDVPPIAARGNGYPIGSSPPSFRRQGD